MASVLCRRAEDDLTGRNREQIQPVDDDSPATVTDSTTPNDYVESMCKQAQLKRKKVVWDDKSLEIFIDICVDQVAAGNRPRTHFTREGWKNVVSKVSKKTGMPYTYKQLKNKWDILKRDWILWTKLIGNETGLVWDPRKGRIDASDSWWSQKLQELPNAAKFRDRGLDHAQKLEFLFSDNVVVGEKPCVASSSVLPQGDLLLTKIVSGMNETLFESLGESSHDNDVNIDNPVSVSTSHSIPGLGIRNKGKRRVGLKSPGKKTKPERIMARFSRKLELICDAVESRSSVTSKRIESKPENNTIQDAVAALRSIPEIERGSDLFMLATELFLKKEYREMFLALKDADLQVAFLRRFEK